MNSGTPGLVQEPFIDELTENCRKQDDLTTKMHSQPDGPDKSQLKAILADIQNTRMLLEKSVPFAFLEIDLQKFSGRTVVYSEPVRQINSRTNDPSSYEFSYFNLKKNFSAFPHEFSTIEKNFIPYPQDPDFPEFQDLLKVRDYDFDLSEQHERDLVLELSYKLWDQNEEGPDVQNLIPNSDVQKKIKQTLKSPPYQPLSDVKRTTMYKYRYWIKGQYPQALGRLLCIINTKGVDFYSKGLELLNDWGKISYEGAVFLLSRKFALQQSYNEEFKLEKNVYEYFYRIREYAVGRFEE